MIYVAHTGHNQVFTRLAERMAKAVPGAEAVTHEQAIERGFQGVTHLITPWWRAAELLLPHMPANVKLILCLYDHKSWQTGGFTAPAHRAMAITASNQKLLKELRDLGIKNAHYLPDGVDCGDFHPGDRVPGLAPHLRVGWCGSSKTTTKRLELLKAVKSKSHKVAIVIQDEIETPLTHDLMPGWYRETDALICLSEHEGTPNPILEACASALPYVSTPVGLVPQIHAETKGGLLLPANPSVDHVLNALAMLAERRDQLHLWGERNRALMQNKYQWNFDVLVKLTAHQTGGAATPRRVPAAIYAKAERKHGRCFRKSRIMIVGQTLGLGGAEKVTVDVANALQESGKYDVDLAMALTADGIYASTLADGVCAFEAKTPADLMALVADRRPDGVLVNNVAMAKDVARELADGGRWYGVLLHGFVPWSLNVLPQDMPEGAEVIVVSGEVRVGLLAARNDLAPDSVTVIENCVDVHRFRPATKKAEVAKSPWRGKVGPIFGFAGRLSAEKDLPTMVRLFAQVREKLPKAKLLIVGGPDGGAIAEHARVWSENQRRIEAAIAQRGVVGAVKITGAVKDPERYYRLMDVALLTSHFEGMPLLAMEAMATGVPVVSTAVGCVPALLASGGGVTIDSGGGAMGPDARAEFVDAMVWMATSPGTSGNDGRAEIVANHSMDRYRADVLDYFATRVPPRRLKVAALYDVEGWAFHMVAEQIRRGMPDADVELVKYADLAAGSLSHVDVAFNPSYVFTAELLGALGPDATVVSCCADHYTWKSEGGAAELEKAVACSSSIVCTNETLMSEVAAKHPRAKLALGMSGVDSIFYSPGPRRRRRKDLVIGWAGSTKYHQHIKGIDMIRRACAAVPGVEFVLADAGERMRSHQEMVEYYNSLDIYVCMSSSEGTCNPILEAAACGVGIISTDVGIASALLASAPAKAGVLIARDVGSLSTALRDAAKDREGVVAMGRNARAAIEDGGWDWKTRVIAYADAIRESAHGE